MSDGTHQCSACVVKLSAADRLTDMVNPSITTSGGQGEQGERKEDTERKRRAKREREEKRNEGETGAFKKKKPCFVFEH